MPNFSHRCVGLPSPLITSLRSWLGFTHGGLNQAAPVQLTSEKGLDFLKMGLGATVCYRFLYIKVSLSDPTFKGEYPLIVLSSPPLPYFGFLQSDDLCNSGRGALGRTPIHCDYTKGKQAGMVCSGALKQGKI